MGILHTLDCFIFILNKQDMMVIVIKLTHSLKMINESSWWTVLIAKLFFPSTSLDHHSFRKFCNGSSYSNKCSIVVWFHFNLIKLQKCKETIESYLQVRPFQVTFWLYFPLTEDKMLQFIFVWEKIRCNQLTFICSLQLLLHV